MIIWNEILIRLLLASILGGLIGLEREKKHWAAGLRTHMMVCVGACLIMIVSTYGFADILGIKNVALDPSRIAAQVVSGIGFIGAGTIFFQKEGVIKGLTTASGLWTVAGIGLATGSGLYFAAASTCVIALIILWGLKPLERKFLKRYKDFILTIISVREINTIDFFTKVVEKEGLTIENFSFKKENNHYLFQIQIENLDIKKVERITDILKENRDILEVNWG